MSERITLGFLRTYKGKSLLLFFLTCLHLSNIWSWYFVSIRDDFGFSDVVLFYRGFADVFGRSQFVSRVGRSSCSRAATCVVQRSVLGALLFCVYVRPLEVIMQWRNTSHQFYADDTQLHLSFDPPAVLHVRNTLSKRLVDIRSWMSADFLKHNCRASPKG